ncbi:MAG: HU family DNA-binding protein [Muribaculaceae bacterium]|nr:HU family DNA-binding protein [Muribaculaceae bacterium]
MENKIAITSLASLLAQSSGKSKKLCEDFLREFFKLTAEALENGESLKIKGFGTFKISDVESRISVNVNTGEPQEIASHKKIVFTPAKEMAVAINAPFEDFESVEMDDEFPENILIQEEELGEDSDNILTDTLITESQSNIIDEINKNEERSDENLVSSQILEAGSIEEGEDDEITYEAYHEEEEKVPLESNQTDEYNLENNTAAFSTENITYDSTENPEVNSEEFSHETDSNFEFEEKPQKSRFGIGFLVGALSTFAVCAVIFMIGCFLDWWPVNFGSPKDLVAEQQTVEKIEPEVIELPVQEESISEKEPVYDTVSTTRYLTTIAREHYGNYNFWPYIYLENESILGHPDRITPGTKVVVPDLSKYGVNPSNKEDVETAKKKAVEIYARFN